MSKKITSIIIKAEHLLELARYPEAETLLLGAVKKDPRNPEAYYLLGEAFCKQEKFTEAVVALRQATILMPQHPRILHLWGWAEFMNGDAKTGRKLLQQALILKPQDIKILCDLAVLEMQLFKYGKARFYIDKALRIAPDNPMVEEVFQVVNAIATISKKFSKKKQS